MPKNRAAVALGRLRGAQLTKEHQSAAGKAAWAGMTPEERSAERSRRSLLTWARRRAKAAADAEAKAADERGR